MIVSKSRLEEVVGRRAILPSVPVDWELESLGAPMTQWWQRQEERPILLQTDLAAGSCRERETDFSIAVIILWNEGQTNTEKGERLEAAFPTNGHWQNVSSFLLDI